MSLPHSKILSPSTGNSKNESKTNVNTEVNINLQSSPPSCAELQTPPVTPVMYPPPANYGEVSPIVEKSIPDIPPNDDTGLVQQLNDSIEFLKLVIRAYKDNTIYMNKYIVLTDTDLCNMLQTLLHAEQIEIVYDDDYDACCTKSKFSKISKVFIHKNGQVHNLKYAYSDIYSMFETYAISLKFVYHATKSTSE